MAAIWFLTVFFLLLLTWREAAIEATRLAYDELLFSVGVFLFLYSLIKIYFYYTDMIRSIFLRYFEQLLFPALLLLGVQNRFLDGYFPHDFDEILPIMCLLYLLGDFSGVAKRTIKETFIGNGWDDQLERNLFFVKYPPKEISDMIIPHFLVIAVLSGLLA